MMQKLILLFVIFFLTCLSANNMKPWSAKLNHLSDFEKHVIVDKGTERAFSGKYVNTKDKGIYKCKVCNAKRIKASNKI